MSEDPNERFVVEKLAGEGGMGKVYRARVRATGEAVALKVLHRAEAVELARFEREAEVLSRIAHANVVRYVAHGLLRDRPFLAMEWLDGVSLSERLGGEPLTLREVVALGTNIADALDVLHANGIIHRDVKPSNLFLVDRDFARVKLVDFGIARGDARELTSTGVLLGTPQYMAPEQARATRDLTGAADVYALGGVLFKAVSGRNAFEADDALGVLIQVVTEEAPSLVALVPEIPRELSELVAEMLAKAPEKRPAPRDVVTRLAMLDVDTEPLALSRRTWEEIPPFSLHAEELTASEQSFRWLVVARSPSPIASELDALRTAVARVAVRLELLADGSVVAWAEGTVSASEQAIRAAHAALAIRSVVPEANAAIVGGRRLQGALGGSSVLAIAARGGGGGGAILVDEDAAKLLFDRFALRRIEVGYALEGVLAGRARPRVVVGQRSSFVGRDRELVMLEATFEECAANSVARVAVVKGPPGIGKSRLREAFFERLNARTMASEEGRRAAPSLWMARGDPMRAHSPFGMIADALHAAIGVAPHDPPDAREAAVRAFVARLVSGADGERVLAFLGELLGVTPARANPRVVQARADAQLLFDQMAQAFEDVLLAESRRAPLVLVLDDVHWADAPTLRLVEGALRSMPEAPIFVLALARPEMSTTFPTLFEDAQKTEIALGPLPRRAAEELVRESLGSDADAALVDRIAERGEGNAFFLEELARGATERAGALDLPTTVLAVVQARLDAMGDARRRALRAASIFGRACWRGGLVALLGGTKREAEVDAVIDELLRAGLVSATARSRFPGERELLFRHALLSDVAYGSLTDADKTLGHRLAAQWLEGMGETDERLVGDHYARGGDETSAAACYARAAAQAFSGNDFEAAIELAKRAMPPTSSLEARARLSTLMADAHFWSGSSAEGYLAAIAAVDMLEAQRGQSLWCHAIALGARHAGRTGPKEAVLAIQRRFLEAVDASPAWVAAAGSVVFAVSSWCDARDAAVIADRAETIAKSLGATDLRTRRALLIGRAAVTYALNKTDVYIGVLGELLEVLEQLDDRRGLALWGSNLGDALRLVGSFESAERRFREALMLAQRIRQGGTVGVTLCNLGMLLGTTGRVDEGIEVELGGIAALDRQRDIRMLGCAWWNLLRLHLLRHDVEGARNALASAGKLETALNLRAALLAAEAAIELERGAVTEAVVLATKAREATSADEELEVWAYVFAVLADARAATGDAAGAREIALVAKARLDGVAASFADKEMAATFLDRVPEHARLRALAG